MRCAQAYSKLMTLWCYRMIKPPDLIWLLEMKYDSVIHYCGKVIVYSVYISISMV